MRKVKVATWSELPSLRPTHALVGNTDLVIIRWDDDVSVLFGRCHHRAALLADGHIEGDNLICGVHGWDYRYRTGVSEYNNDEKLHRFGAWIENDALLVDADEIAAWEDDNPQPYHRHDYQGSYQDFHGTVEEPHVRYIQELAANGLQKTGHHGPVSAMGVAGPTLPGWDDIQFVLPLLGEAMALGADGVALANSAIQAIGCLGMRACHTNNCPVGIATQREDLRARLIVDEAARRLERFLSASVSLMKTLARACGHTHLNQFSMGDLTTWKRDMAHLTGVRYAGVNL